jgi:hypothetical protein
MSWPKLTVWGGGEEYFTRSTDFYLPFLRCDEGGGGGKHPGVQISKFGRALLKIHIGGKVSSYIRKCVNI